MACLGGCLSKVSYRACLRAHVLVNLQTTGTFRVSVLCAGCIFRVRTGIEIPG